MPKTVTKPVCHKQVFGQPVFTALTPRVFLELFDATEEPKAWLITFGVALVLAVASRFVLSWRGTAALFAAGVFALLPPVVVGHAEVGAWHDVATNAIVWHVVAASVWVGALVAFLTSRGKDPEIVRRRYHRLTVICWLVLGVSGIVEGFLLTGPDGFTGRYGLFVLAKAAGFAVLGVACAWLRRRLPSRAVAVELAVLAVMTAVSAGLARIPPPTFFTRAPSAQNTILGYEVPDPPTVLRMVLGWRFDLVFGTVAVVAAALYLFGMRRLRRRGDTWPVGRAVAWIGGWAVVVVVTSSGVGVYAPAMFSTHMAVHMALTMLAPVLLVLGGPVTLALRALPATDRAGPAGPRAWLLALVHSPLARFLTHPLVAAVVFVGSYYVLYFSGLFGEAMLYHWSHQLMNAHFLVTGYLFYWLVIGVDTGPRTLPHLARLGLVFSVMPFHAFFGVIVMNKQDLIGETFYRYLGVLWNPDLLADQRLGGGIAWAAGEIPLVLVMIALLAQWARHDDREARRVDRRLDSGASDEFDAYNAMLAKLSGKGNKT
ncbi:cytochrome c oxidase assembly protein [Amycolatopsis sp. CA-230715]|uniref:cytochrome c oxidase assembly protein n=1 Tax=Amycolatopsis sp. CA-230715 TaxID=2745196 RepID=UPI0020B417D5|nr:cytochrome c oxidase assembly protein [Amycolatopsis sp. CA-230715]